MCWLWLILAIGLEVAATVCLKLSNGFSRLVPTAAMALGYGSSIFLMAVALRKMEVATAYAVWSAVGTALMTMIGVLWFKESASPLKLSAIALILVGVVCLNLASRQAPAAGKDERTIATLIDRSAGTSATAVVQEPKASGRVQLVAKR